MSALSREMLGAVVVCMVGSLLHFVFSWAGYWKPLALFAAVNESIWEHLKLAFWPGFFWALAVRRGYDCSHSNYWAIRGLALVIPPVVIVLIFKSYTTILGKNLLFLDISTFFVAVFVGQYIAAKLLQTKILGYWLARGGIVLLATQLVSFSTLTFYPPNVGMFTEARSGAKGIPTMESGHKQDEAY